MVGVLLWTRTIVLGRSLGRSSLQILWICRCFFHTQEHMFCELQMTKMAVTLVIAAILVPGEFCR